MEFFQFGYRGHLTRKILEAGSLRQLTSLVESGHFGGAHMYPDQDAMLGWAVPRTR
jgi:hypothetical protein